MFGRDTQWISWTRMSAHVCVFVYVYIYTCAQTHSYACHVMQQSGCPLMILSSCCNFRIKCWVWVGRHQNYLVNFVHPALSTSYPPSCRGDWCYALWTCSPYASICNGAFARCNGNSKTISLDITLVRQRGKTEWDRFASEAVVLRYSILSLRCCMLFSPLRVGCARDARVYTHACVLYMTCLYILFTSMRTVMFLCIVGTRLSYKGAYCLDDDVLANVVVHQ